MLHSELAQEAGKGKIKMASIYDLKPKFQGLLRPLTRKLAEAGVSANQVTLTAALLSIVAGILIAIPSKPSTALIKV
ncbi:MAG TPA: hypothetical protein ENI80_02655 [Acidiferrobacteraceae bacterium]|nr:hypothetical protein [Acidiferrobacteraceae bacterium]